MPNCLARQARIAAGFVRHRLQDAVGFGWRLIEAILASRELSNLVVLLATLGVAAGSIHGAGLYGVVSNLGNIAVTWAAASGLIGVGRRYCDVKPPKPKLRRRKQ